VSLKHRIEKQTIKIADWGEIFKPRFRILFKRSYCGRAHERLAKVGTAQTLPRLEELVELEGQLEELCGECEA